MNAVKVACTRDMPREEWLALRRQGIGGSDAGAILGLSPWASPLSIYCEKKGLIPEREDTEAMRQGRDFEEYVAQRFTERTGKAVRRCNYLLQHPDYPFMFANVDRLVKGEDAGLECKTTSVLTRTDYSAGDVPPQYYAQCQHYMAVTGCKKWYLAVLILNRDFHVFEVPRNEEDIAALIEAEKAFWENHVVPGVMPAPNGSEADGEILKQMSGEVDPDLIAPLYGLEELVKKLVTIKAEIKKLEEDKRLCEQRIQQKMGSATFGRANGFIVKWPQVLRADIDREKLKQEFPDVYEKVKTIVKMRRFTIKEEKAI